MNKKNKILLPLILIFSLTLSLFSQDETVIKTPEQNYRPSVQAFKNLIDKDPVIRMYICEMISQVPEKYKSFTNIEEFLKEINNILNKAPEFSSNPITVLPLTNILVRTMSTQAGFTVYTNKRINNIIKNILVEWEQFLNSPESLYVLNDSPSGWKSDAAKNRLKMDNYLYNPEEKYWGFKSWNDFFTRKLTEGVRPIAEPENNKIIVSACDSTVYRIKRKVKKEDMFWIKEQPYSLKDMLANDELTDQFEGGSVLQAFLSIFNYHRWHSPVSGTIKKAYVVDGLYFSKTNMVGSDLKGQFKSQAYIAHVQTRALIFIEADDPEIGLICFVPIGMVEVSSCKIDTKIKPGYHVKKGEELGYFQFGGSTNCLVFRPGVIKKFTAKKGKFYKVGEPIAIAK